MNEPKVIDDELWDHYSGLPNPLWYQYIKELEKEEDEEENNTTNNTDTSVSKK